MPRKPDVPCAGGCGKLLWRGKGTLPPGQATCRPCRSIHHGKTRPAAVCAQCSSPFLSVKGGHGWTKCCSKSCAGKLRNAGRVLVGPERDKARQRAKTHKRKTVGRHTDITLEYEQALRRKAKRCPLCQVRMTSKPYLPNSKELDHIVPLNVGGTHTMGNVRIICRRCNQARPDDGSDYTGPVTLWAAMPGFVPPPERVPPPTPRCEHGVPHSYRCRTCNPPQEPCRAADGRRAAVLRAEGWAWKDIATATRFTGTGACYQAARAHGLPEVVARWPPRYVNVGAEPAPVRTRVPTPVVCVDCTDPVAQGSIRCSECLVEIEESYAESHEPLAVAS